MGSLKDQASEVAAEDIRQHKLEDSEVSYLRLLNLALQYHTMGQKMMSGFLYYVASHRLGYKQGVNLQFEFDFNSDSNILMVRLLPANTEEAVAAANKAVQESIDERTKEQGQ